MARVLAICLAAIFVASCAPSIRSQKNAYSYLGRIVERTDDVDLAPPQPHPLGRDYYLMQYGLAGAAMFEAFEATRSSPRTEYQRYTVLLEQGEKMTLRSKRQDLGPGDCARVWIYGPGVSPTYLYMPDTAEIDKAVECKGAQR